MTSDYRRPRLRGFRSLLVLIGAFAFAIPGGALTAAPVMAADPAPIVNTGTIAPGVHVGSIDLSGLDEATARQVLTQAFASIGQGQIVVTADSKQQSIPFSAVNRHVDIDALINAAFAVGRSGTAMARLVSLVQTMAAGSSLEPTVVFDEAALAQRLSAAATAMQTVYTNAKVVRTSTKFTTVPSAPGRRYNATSVIPYLSAQLTNIDAPAAIGAALQGTDWPANISNDDAAAAAAKATKMSAPLTLANGGQKWV